jgi:small ligand-binding sensory domain FIST
MESFRVVHASGGDWQEMTDRCLAAIGTLPDGVNVGFVYITDVLDEDLRNVVNALRKKTRIDDWVGTIGFGICVSGRELFDTPAMAVMVGAVPSDDYRILPPVTDENPDLPPDIVEWAAAQGSVIGIVHADPGVDALENILSRIQDQTGCFLVGGMTGSRGAVDQVAGNVVNKCVSGILFGGDIAAVTALTQGCSPIGPLHDVTEGRDNIIHTLDGRPAMDVFREDIGELLARDLSKISGYVHAAIPIAGSDTGDYLVRNLLGLFPEQGWVSIAERLGVNDRVMFVRRDGTTAMADLKRMVSNVKRRADAPPRAAFYFTCVARGPNLFGPGSAELRTIADILGDIPLIGFYANGEISNDRLYGYTGVLTLLS